MKDNKKLLGSLIAGANTGALAIIQHCFSGSEYLEVLTICTPLVITPLVYAGDWFFALFDIQSPGHMRADSKLEKRIKRLADRRKEAQIMGICTKKIDLEYQEAVLAQSKLMDVKEVK